MAEIARSPLYERIRAKLHRRGLTDEQIDQLEAAFEGSPEALALQEAIRAVAETARRTMR